MNHLSITRFFAFLLVFLFSSIVAEAQFQVRVKFNEIANLTYQLDCVSDSPVNCSQKNFTELWNREFIKSATDREMIAEWKRLRETYAQDFKLSDNEGGEYSVSIFEKLRIAGFQSDSIEDYTKRLDLLTAPVDRDSFERIIRHFEPRFKTWWEREAAKNGDEFARQTDALIRSPKISVPLRQFYNFYEPVLPENYELMFNLFYTPNFLSEPSNGQQIQNYSIAEFTPGEKPEQRIDVVIHELCHFLYENAKPENEEQLEKRFYALNRASVVPARNLLNEALATTFGNGIISRAVSAPAEYARYASKPRSFYNNDGIDRAAKANLTWIDDWLKQGKTINDPQFVEQYVSNLEKAFGEDLTKPKFYLGEQFLFVDTKIGSLRRDVRRKLEVFSFYAAEGNWNERGLFDAYKSHPNLTSIFIVHPDNLGELVSGQFIDEAQLAEIRAEYNQKGSVLYGSERAPFIYKYIIVAKDKDSAIKLIDQLAAAKQFKGIYR
jgi:hypothetical protein